MKGDLDMPSEDEGSVTRWIGDLKAGGDAAAQHLWERYFNRLVHLARSKLRSARRQRVVEDEEDAAVSAFDSFCRGAAEGRFPRLTDRHDLWRLLVVLTVRKALRQVERQSAVKRGGAQWLSNPAGTDGEHDCAALHFIAGREPSPELAAMVAEQYLRLRNALGDDSLREVLDLRLQGHSREEIAAGRGCAVRTVTRKLEMIRQAWLGQES
jgi:hypothetical protein